MMREYHWTLRDWYAAEPTTVNALYAAACEYAGLIPTESYREKEMRKYIDLIMDGKAGHLGYY